jgi:hypothetical protein
LERLVKRLLLVAAALSLALTGCASQISGLAPVGGDDITGVRIAAINVLLQNDVAIKTAPICRDVDTGYACSGTTVDGKAIEVTADDDADDPAMIVTVDGAVIYQGSMMRKLDEAAQATS